MNKYVVISDPIRSKEFAVVGEVDGSLIFKPLNEVAKTWANENSSAKSLDSISVPSGMYVSSPKKMTTSIMVMLEQEKKSFQEVAEEVKIEEISKSGLIFSGRKINSLGKKQNLSNVQIRKISKQSKTQAIDYKAGAFLNRAKKSSIISRIRSGGSKLDSKKALFVNRNDQSIDVLSKTAGVGMVRRLAVSNFITDSKNRLSRRSKSLTCISVENDENTPNSSAIDISISSKAGRFI